MTHLLSDVGLGIVSWRGHETLRPVLESLVGTEDIFGERVIYFNEITADDRRIASEFGFASFGTPENTGIYGGFRGLAESMKSRYVLLQENDCHLIESLESVRRQLEFGVSFLESGRADVVRYIHLRRPGHRMPRDSYFLDFVGTYPSEVAIQPSEGMVNYFIKNFRRYYPDPDASLWTRLRLWRRRYRHPDKAAFALSYAPFLMDRPDEIFPEIERDDESGFFITPSQHYGWGNLCSLLDRRRYIDTILSRVEEVDGSRLVNGFKDIEAQLSDGWWRSHYRYVCEAAPGLFMHERHAHRGH